MSAYKMRIKFDNKDWLVIDNFIVENVKYYYIIEDKSEELEKVNNIEDYKGNINMNFIYSEKNDGIYKNVTDKELFNQLLAIVGYRNMKNLQ